jgi:hypothetical protein
MIPLLEAAKKVLSESPLMIPGSRSTSSYEMMPHKTRYSDHIESGEVIHSSSDSIITHLPVEQFEQRSYLKRSSVGAAIFSMRFNKANIIPDKSGEYASMIVKSPKVNENQYSDIKRCYDHALSKNDYIASDKHQMTGGKNTWNKLATDYHAEGKHLYISTPTELKQITPDWINSNEDSIWGDEDHHENTRLVVSHKEI